MRIGRRAKSTFQVDVEIRLEITELPDVSNEVLNRLAYEEWLRVWADILKMVEARYPHVSISSKYMETK